MIDSFAFHLTAARVFLPQGFSLACIDAGVVFSTDSPRAFNCVPRAYADQSIHAQTIIPFVLQEHTLTRASMAKPYFRSCSKNIR